MASISESAQILVCAEAAHIKLIIERCEEDVRVLVEVNGDRWEDENVTVADLRIMANVLDRLVTNAETHPFAQTSKAKQQ